MQQLMQRLNDLIKAKAHHAIDQMEEPERMLKQYLRELDQEMRGIRLQLARAVARRAREAQEARDAGATVGAVARDARGHLAAATSTGGMTAKHPGRVSDSALVGSGTWADDETCAISGTGHGELFIRAAFAHEVHALLRYAGLDLETACRRALAQVASLGGEGGCIAVDREGRVASPFDTPGMPRGLVRAGAPLRVALASDEDLEA